MDLAARPLHVARLDLVAVPDADHAVFEMVCGKGGYVRAIARDLGQALGTLAHVTALRRLWSGPFRAEDGVDPQALADLPADDRAARLLPLETALAGLPEVRLSAEGAVRVRNGNPGDCVFAAAAPGDTAWASHQGRAVAVGVYMGGALHPNRVFNL
jgi:tRNA pseudouridine55 synthase